MEATSPLFLCCLSLSVVISCAGRVPVLVGSTNKVHTQDSSLRAGHAATSTDLRRIVAPFLSTELHCVVVFDDLKLSDFAVHGDAYSPDGHGSLFRHTKAFLDGAQTTLSVPSVDSVEASPEDVVRSLLRQDKPSLHVQHLSPSQPEEVKSLLFTPGKPTLWLVHLPAGSVSDGRVSALRQSDAIIGALHRQLVQYKQYSFTITSKSGEKSEDEMRDVDHSRSASRHLLATTTDVQLENGHKRCTLVCFSCGNETGNDPTATSPCVHPAVLLCYRNISVSLIEALNSTYTLSTVGNVTTVTPQQEMSGCINGNVNLMERLAVTLDLNNPASPYQASLEFNFQRTKAFTASLTNSNGSYWEVVTVAVRYSGRKVGCRTVFPVDEALWLFAPLNQSYNCLPSTLWTQDNTFRTGNTSHYEAQFCGNTAHDLNVSMVLEGIQLQAYAFTTAAGPRFDQAADCVGYFTGVTWMGIIVVFLFVSVIFMASMAFLATETPDRFDDPKGKNIQVQ